MPVFVSSLGVGNDPVVKHGGPGPHKGTGTAQSVHGGGGGSRGGAGWSGPGPRGTAPEMRRQLPNASRFGVLSRSEARRISGKKSVIDRVREKIETGVELAGDYLEDQERRSQLAYATFGKSLEELTDGELVAIIRATTPG